MATSYENLKKLSHKNSEVEFEAQIPDALMIVAAEEALQDIAAGFEMPGFRKGKVPLEVVRKQVSEMDLLEDALQGALKEAVQEIARDEKLMVVGAPSVTVTKLAPKNPAVFKVRFALFPEVQLPDYKRIGREVTKRKDDLKVSDKELEDAVNHIRTMVGSTMKQDTAAPLPEITDEVAAKLGPFKTKEEFREGLKKQLAEEKEMNAKSNKRNEIVKKIVENAKLDLPELLTLQELSAVRHDRNAYLNEKGLSKEECLKQIGKTEEELIKAEREQIVERLKTGFVLGEIRKKENVRADEKEVATLMMRLKMRHPDRSEEEVRETAEAIAVQEKLFVLLEAVS